MIKIITKNGEYHDDLYLYKKTIPVVQLAIDECEDLNNIDINFNKYHKQTIKYYIYILESILSDISINESINKLEEEYICELIEFIHSIIYVVIIIKHYHKICILQIY
jgi:hypothetical protein